MTKRQDRLDERVGASMATIHGSVGRAGKNEYNDVRVIQGLLTTRGFDPGIVDGLCGTKTIGAIVRFQATRMKNPDGRVDPGGKTLRGLESGGGVMPPADVAKDSVGARKNFTDLVGVPAGINSGLSAVSNAYMKTKFGNPRESYSQDCQPMTNTKLKNHITSQSMGNFSARGLRPAVDSLSLVFADIAAADPVLFSAIGTAGMLCCRLQRNSTTAVSNHSWGTAIDLTMDGVLDPRGDGKVQYGLTLIAPYFNARGWYWGAAFGTEDAMHFEAGRALTDGWATMLNL